MDISSSIHEDDEIRHILEELTVEKEKFHTNIKSRKQLEHISVICFTRNVQSIVDKLFRVSVKIFDSANDIYALDISKSIDIIENKNCKYYLVQIHSSQSLQSNLINNNWIANVSVKNDGNNVSKTVHLKRLIPSDTFNIIVPFSYSVKDAVIETRFFSPSENYWPNLEISCINTNISYHFLPFHEDRLLHRKQESILFTISKLYTEDVKLKQVEPFFQYTFNCKADIRHFYEVILKNCIHRMDINHMQLLATSIDGVASVSLTVDQTSSSITLDTENKILKIAANVDVLHRIKQFLISNLREEKHKKIMDEMLLTRLSNIKLNLSMEGRDKKPINIDVIKQLYQEYKNIISQLPM